MPTPFPGMDPYLERSPLWEGLHTRLIVAIADALMPLVRPKYRVDVERRTYLAVLSPDDFAGKPDVLVFQPGRGSAALAPVTAFNGGTRLVAELPMPEEVVERFLEIRDVQSSEVVTVIEILSPVNKANPTGRNEYNEKRQKVLASHTNLIEIDLLRVGQPPPLRLQSEQTSHYRMMVSRAWQRPYAEVNLFSVRQPIPSFTIPLRRNEPEALLDLNQILHDLYDRAGYDLGIDYRQPAHPPLKGEDATWADQLLRACGLR